jgi:hypothetical protein
MAVAQGQVQSAKTVNNLESHAQVQDTDMDESRTAGVMDILEHLVPRLLVNAAMEFETAYHDMPEPMGELLLQLQQRDVFAMEQLEKLPQALVGQAECLSWERSKDDLLRYEKKAYVPANYAVRAEILRMNHDDSQSDHFDQKCILEAVHRKYYWHDMMQDVKNHILICDSC